MGKHLPARAAPQPSPPLNHPIDQAPSQATSQGAARGVPAYPMGLSGHLIDHRQTLHIVATN